MNYEEFIESKKTIHYSAGLSIEREKLNPILFDFQKDIVKWALKKGKAAIFADTGLGKTFIQCEWAKHIAEHTQRKVLILAPLAVSNQTINEAKKIGIEINPCRSQEDVKAGINIANYEIIHKFNPDEFAGIVLDESSILKAYDSKTRDILIKTFNKTPFRLACTATPAPNDFMELGNHAEFLGVMTRPEMLATFFIHDGGDTSKWRLKGHAQNKFWEWVSSWAVVLSRPSDLGYEDGKFNLPPLSIYEEVIKSKAPIGSLFVVEAQTLQERRQARRDSLAERVNRCAEMVNSTTDPFLVWCDLNAESESLKRAIPDAVEVKGSDDNEHKIKAMAGFSDGSIRVLVTKPSIAGYGMNWQHCANMAFVGLSDSFEQYYQAVRRCWRFGQEKPVNVYIIISEREGAVKANIERKERDAQILVSEMINYTKDITKKNIRQTYRNISEYEPKETMVLPEWLGGNKIA